MDFPGVLAIVFLIGGITENLMQPPMGGEIGWKLFFPAVIACVLFARLIWSLDLRRHLHNHSTSIRPHIWSTSCDAIWFLADSLTVRDNINSIDGGQG